MTMKQKILVVGRHASIMEKVLQMLENNDYSAFGVSTDEAAVEILETQKLDVLVIGGGVSLESTNYLTQIAQKFQPNIKVVLAHPQTILSDIEKALNG